MSQAPSFLLLLLLNSSVLFLILISALKNILPPSSNPVITSSGQFGISVRFSPSTQLLPLQAVSFSLAWITAFPFSKVCASLIHSLHCVQNKLAKLVLLNPTLNSTDCLKQLHSLPIHNRIIFKQPSWRIELSQHPIHPISNTSLSAAMHLFFFHLPPIKYANQFTNHPSSIRQQKLLLCLSWCLVRITPPSS